MPLLRRYWLEAAWALFACANVVAILVLTEYETIPFHFVWVSLALLYCVRPWSVGVTAAVLALVMLATGIALGTVVYEEGAGYDELSEVPLMAAMYVVIVWNARRWLRAMEERRRASEREKDFVRDASHMLRTPITVALGHAELARADANPRCGEDIEIVIDELERISTISDRLLLLASAGHERFLDRERVDIGDLLRTAAKRWEPTALRDWVVVIGAEGTITADEERLSLALDCLVENAIKATSEEDRITIAERAKGTTLFLEVADTGAGVPPEYHGAIFERFSRAERSTARNGSTGLGLAIVKAVAEAHGGSVRVESARGEGATFIVQLDGFAPSSPAEVNGRGELAVAGGNTRIPSR